MAVRVPILLCKVLLCEGLGERMVVGNEEERGSPKARVSKC